MTKVDLRKSSLTIRVTESGVGVGVGVDCSRGSSRENTQQNLIHKQLFEQCG